MANVIIKSDERIVRENEILARCGHNPETANSEQREMAQLISEKTYEEIKKMEAKQK